MNQLLAKEIRLVLPAFGAALVLAIVPMWLLPDRLTDTFTVYALYPFCFGTVLVALSPFGREFTLNTFPVLLAQPLERSHVWRTKIAVLAVALVAVFGAWCLSGAAHFASSLVTGYDIYPAYLMEQSAGPKNFVAGGVVALALLSGGLWTTLLLRQVTASFWFTILIPATIAMVIDLFGGGNVATFTALGLYSVAGVVLAHKLFRHAEETAWTGGTILLARLKGTQVAVKSDIRHRQPWAAIIRKEFQLHQIGLAGIGVLFVLHLATLAFHHGDHDDKLANTMRAVSDLCCLLWCIVPLVLGGTSVAEERKLGTMEAHLCLPVSSRAQFAVKLAFVVLFGGVLSAALLWIKVQIGHAMNGLPDFGEMKIGTDFASFRNLACLFSGVALIAFYASTLTRNIMQALAAGVVTVAVVFLLTMAVTNNMIPYGPFSRFVDRTLPWHGYLVDFIGLPTLVAAFVWLSLRNFRRLPETWRLWRRNLVGLAATLLFITTATAALYNRAWELVLPLEPRHGPAVIAGDQPPVLRSDYTYRNSLNLLLPDGRLWESRVSMAGGWHFGEALPLGMGIQWTSLAGNHFVEGSNWAGAAVLFANIVAIRSDGSLWISEKPHVRTFPVRNGRLLPDKADVLVKYGDESGWKSVMTMDGNSALLLKTDGTLWLWEPLGLDGKKPWPGIRAFQPHRLGAATDWAEIKSVSGDHRAPWLLAWKTDGTAWAVTGRNYNYPPNRKLLSDELEPGKGLERQAELDKTRWRSLADWEPLWEPFRTGVRDDGTLWVWNLRDLRGGGSRLEKELVGRMAEVGNDHDWQAVASDHNSLVALKTDGTLWKWEPGPDPWPAKMGWPVTKPPVRVGTRHDWVAVCGAVGGTVSLAADGSLWYWWNRDNPYYPEGGYPVLAASRKPVRLGNIFGQE